MKKRLMGMMLVLCILLTNLPITALAATSGNINYYDNDVTWLGTTAEYQKTLRAFFDAGLRRISVDGKYGLVDMEGNWAAQPIYDEIEAYYWREKSDGRKTSNPIEDDSKETESIFVDGYVQAVRDGKMGLLDTTGKEVIPCNYDAVGLPAEGVSRISRVINGITYLGYWNLELGKEIVAPNKYPLPRYYEDCGSAEGGIIDQFYIPDLEEGKYPVVFNFYKGYALVLTGEVVNVVQERDGVSSEGVEATLAYAQIIDKNGKEVLPKPYPFNLAPKISRAYPQAGPYLVYDELSNKKLRMIADGGGYNVIFNSHIESGIVGPQGIIVPAQYHGGIWGSAKAWYPPGACMQIIPELSLAVTMKCGYDGFRESAARLGVINFNNKAIIPFGTLDYLDYDSKNQVFLGGVYEAIYRPDGTKISGSEGRAYYILEQNGYLFKGDTNYEGKITSIESIMSVKTGKSYSHENLKGSEATGISAQDTLWVKKDDRWGLVKVDGTIVLPFEYEEIYDKYWQDPKIPVAGVKKNGKWGIVDIAGKFVLPCHYRSIGLQRDGYVNIEDDETGRYGIFNLNTCQITTPCQYPNPLHRPTVNMEGTSIIPVENGWLALFDMDTGKQVTGNYQSMEILNRGLFINSNRDKIGPDGRIVFTSNEEVSEHTLVVKNGKVGAIPVSRLKVGDKLPTTPYVKPTPAVKESFVAGTIANYPHKGLYYVGESFDITGLTVHLKDSTGAFTVADNSKLRFYVTYDMKEVKLGQKFFEPGTFYIEVQYNGKRVGSFAIQIINEDRSKFVESGDYYLQIYGKYISPVGKNGDYTFVLAEEQPEKPFHINMVGYDPERGPKFIITYDGYVVRQLTTKNGALLQTLSSSNFDHLWRINKYAAFCTIRVYSNQKLAVNASGNKNDNGTKITVWGYTGAAPEHVKITFLPVK